MTTEQKIREAFEKYRKLKIGVPYYYEDFEAGYLALLNDLELVGENKVEKLYRLPEGVNRD
jgi:hypothetical protein